VTTTQERFGAFRSALEQEFVEREDHIEALLYALIARQHIFLLGPPGVAKSMLFRRAAELISGLNPEEYFEILLMKGTVTEEIFGPPSLALLKQDRFVRKTAGFLPSAKLAFLDEFWKGNSAIINAMLMIMNERRFRNDGQTAEVPLWSMFSASNEMPENEDLAAMYDRTLLRLKVNPIQEPGNLEDVCKIFLGRTLRAGEPVLSWSDIETAHEESRQVAVPDDVISALVELKQDLESDHGISVTDRRLVQSLSIVQAAAWLDGATETDVEHLRPLRFVLWNTPDEIPFVETKALALANPIDREAMELLDVIQKISAEVEAAIRDDLDEERKTQIGVEMHNKLDDIKDDLKSLISKASGSKRKSPKVKECRKALRALTFRLLTGLFREDPENIDEDSLEE